MSLAFHNDKDKEVDKNGDNFERLWKIRESLDILQVVYSKVYNPSEHMATDAVSTFQREGCILAVYPKETQMFRN
jgi:hypothetical protein